LAELRKKAIRLREEPLQNTANNDIPVARLPSSSQIIAIEKAFPFLLSLHNPLFIPLFGTLFFFLYPT
jgi:hypothetical protein